MSNRVVSNLGHTTTHVPKVSLGVNTIVTRFAREFEGLTLLLLTHLRHHA